MLRVKLIYGYPYYRQGVFVKGAVTMSITLQWILAGAFFFLPGALMVGLNYYLIIMGIKNSKLPKEEQKRYPSGAPLYGGILCAVGLLIALRFKHPWVALIPILLDPGGISGFVYWLLGEPKIK
jgi:hypothetical protein